MASPENSHHITALLMIHARGIKKTKIDELKLIVAQASKTFEHNQMMVFSRAAKILSEQDEWTGYDRTRARCMALYHMYMMFYQNPGCPVCQVFLQKITTYYSRALKKSQNVEELPIAGEC